MRSPPRPLDSGSVTDGDKGSEKDLVRTGVVGAGGVEPPSSSVSDPTRISPLEFETVRHSEEPCRNRRSPALSARRLAHDSPWFVCARTGPSGRRLLPVCCRWWTLGSFDTSMSPGSLPSRGGVSRVCVGRPCSRSAAPCCRQGAPAHVRDVLSEPGRTRIMRNPGLQLLEDLVQPSVWTVCGKQHRQVDQAPGVSGPFELW